MHGEGHFLPFSQDASPMLHSLPPASPVFGRYQDAAYAFSYLQSPDGMMYPGYGDPRRVPWAAAAITGPATGTPPSTGIHGMPLLPSTQQLTHDAEASSFNSSSWPLLPAVLENRWGNGFMADGSSSSPSLLMDMTSSYADRSLGLNWLSATYDTIYIPSQNGHPSAEQISPLTSPELIRGSFFQHSIFPHNEESASSEQSLGYALDGSVSVPASQSTSLRNASNQNGMSDASCTGRRRESLKKEQHHNVSRSKGSRCADQSCSSLEPEPRRIRLMVPGNAQSLRATPAAALHPEGVSSIPTALPEQMFFSSSETGIMSSSADCAGCSASHYGSASALYGAAGNNGSVLDPPLSESNNVPYSSVFLLSDYAQRTASWCNGLLSVAAYDSNSFYNCYNNGTSCTVPDNNGALHGTKRSLTFGTAPPQQNDKSAGVGSFPFTSGFVLPVSSSSSSVPPYCAGKQSTFPTSSSLLYLPQTPSSSTYDFYSSSARQNGLLPSSFANSVASSSPPSSALFTKGYTSTSVPLHTAFSAGSYDPPAASGAASAPVLSLPPSSAIVVTSDAVRFNEPRTVRAEAGNVLDACTIDVDDDDGDDIVLEKVAVARPTSQAATTSSLFQTSSVGSQRDSDYNNSIAAAQISNIKDEQKNLVASFSVPAYSERPTAVVGSLPAALNSSEPTGDPVLLSCSAISDDAMQRPSPQPLASVTGASMSPLGPVAVVLPSQNFCSSKSYPTLFSSTDGIKRYGGVSSSRPVTQDGDRCTSVVHHQQQDDKTGVALQAATACSVTGSSVTQAFVPHLKPNSVAHTENCYATPQTNVLTSPSACYDLRLTQRFQVHREDNAIMPAFASSSCLTTSSPRSSAPSASMPCSYNNGSALLVVSGAGKKPTGVRAPPAVVLSTAPRNDSSLSSSSCLDISSGYSPLQSAADILQCGGKWNGQRAEPLAIVAGHPVVSSSPVLLNGDDAVAPSTGSNQSVSLEIMTSSSSPVKVDSPTSSNLVPSTADLKTEEDSEPEVEIATTKDIPLLSTQTLLKSETEVFEGESNDGKDDADKKTQETDMTDTASSLCSNDVLTFSTASEAEALSPSVAALRSSCVDENVAALCSGSQQNGLFPETFIEGHVAVPLALGLITIFDRIFNDEQRLKQRQLEVLLTRFLPVAANRAPSPATAHMLGPLLKRMLGSALDVYTHLWENLSRSESTIIKDVESRSLHCAETTTMLVRCTATFCSTLDHFNLDWLSQLELQGDILPIPPLKKNVYRKLLVHYFEPDILSRRNRRVETISSLFRSLPGVILRRGHTISSLAISPSASSSGSALPDSTVVEKSETPQEER